MVNYFVKLLEPWQKVVWTPHLSILLDGNQLSQKMNLIVPHQLRQQLDNLIYQIFWDTFLPQSKTNNFPWHQINSFFHFNKYKKQLIFDSEFFFRTPQNKHSINSSFPWHKPILHFIDIYDLTQTPMQNLVQFKSMSQQLYSAVRVCIKGIPFPLKTQHPLLQ